MHKVYLPLISALALMACTSNSTPESAPAASAEGPEGVAQVTVADHLGIEPQAVEIRSVEAVEFSDSGLGCPQPDMAYLAVITPGHKVMAKANGELFDVRVSGKHGLICEPGIRTLPKR